MMKTLVRTIPRSGHLTVNFSASLRGRARIFIVNDGRTPAQWMRMRPSGITKVEG